MTTSGTATYNQSRVEIIQDAFALIGAYGVGRTVSSDDMTIANRILNKMIKAWQAKGLLLWAKSEGYLFAVKGTSKYTLDGSSSYFCTRSDAAITELTVAAAASATSLTVTSTTGMANNDYIGIELADGTCHFTTISNVATSTTLTIASGLASAAAVGANVYALTTKVTKPMRILSMRRVTGVGSSESAIIMSSISHEEYFNLSMKNTQGMPTHFFYEPKLTSGDLYLWPAPQTTENYYEITYERQLEDITADSQTPDFPAEWQEAITYQLATRLAPVFGFPDRIQDLLPIASEMLLQVMEFDAEINSVQLRIER